MGVAYALVIARDDPGSCVSSCRVRADGRYMLPLAKPGRHQVTLYRPFARQAELSTWTLEMATVIVK